MSDPFSDPHASPFEDGWQQPPSTGGPSPDGPPPLPQDGGAWAPQGSGWGQPPGAPPGWQQPAPPPGPQGFGPQGFGQQGFGQQPGQASFGGPPPAFGQPAPFGQGQPYPTQSSSSGSKVLVIVLVVVGLVILGVVGAAVAIFRTAGDVVVEVGEAFDSSGSGALPAGTGLLDTTSQVVGDRPTSFEFSVPDRTLVQIDVLGQDGFDPVTTLIGPGGERLEEDDDGGSGFDSQIVQTLGSGTYTVEVEGFAGDTGDFRIVVTDR